MTHFFCFVSNFSNLVRETNFFLFHPELHLFAIYLTYPEAGTEREEIAQEDGEEHHMAIKTVSSFVELLKSGPHVPKLL